MKIYDKKHKYIDYAFLNSTSIFYFVQSKQVY